VYGFFLSLVMAYGGAVVALFQPLIGLIIYTIFSLVRPQQLFAFAGNLAGISEVIGVATLIGWVFKGLGDWNFRRSSPHVWLLLGFFLFTCLSALFADNGLIAQDYVIQRLKIVVMFLVGLTLIDSMAWVRRLAWALVIAQGYVGFEMNLSYVNGYNLAAENGLLGDNNSFAISMVGGLGPAIFLGISAKQWWKKGVAFTCAALILHTVLLTFSRGGMLALIVTGAVVFVMMPKRLSMLLPVVLAAGLTVRLMGPEVTARFMTTFAEGEERDSSAESRLDLWADCLELVRRHPITGVGPSHFPLVAPEFGWPPGKSAHSTWMQAAAELGVPATFFFLAFNVYGMWRGLVMARRHARDELGPFGLYVFSGMAGYIVAAQFVSIEGLELPYYTVLIVAAVEKLQAQEAPVESMVQQPVPQWVSRTL
jgi:O-antigen ligase